MANNDAELTLRLNVSKAEEDAKKIPEMLKSALNSIKGKGLDTLEKQLDEALKNSEKLQAEFSKVNTELDQIDKNSKELKALSDLKLPLSEEIAAEEAGVKRLQKAWLSTWQVKPDSAGAKKNREEYEILNTKLAENKSLLGQLNAEEASLKSKIEESNTVINSTLSSYEQQKITAGQLVADAEKQAQAFASLTTDTKEEATNTASIKENLDGATSSAGELATDIKEISAASANNPLNNITGASAETEAASQSIQDLVVRLHGYNEALLALQKTGGDTAVVEQQIADTTQQLNEKLSFDPSKASIAELIRYLMELVAAEKKIKGELQMPADLDAPFNRIKGAIVSTRQAIRDSESDFKRAPTTFRDAMDKVPGVVRKVTSGIKSGFQMASKAVNKAVGIMRSAVNGFVKIVKSGFSAISKSINKVKSHFDGMSGSMKSNFKHLLTSLTKYVFGFRSLFFLVRRLRKYVGEGIQNMAQFNKGNNMVNHSITNLLTSLLYLKNAWAAAFSPIITFVEGWLTTLIDKLAATGNALARFLGNLLGQSKVFQAVKTPAKDYAKSLDNAGASAGKAAKKQKKLNDRLAAFDDLNVLGKDKNPDNSGTGGGGGAGNNLDLDPNKMFKIVGVGNDLLKKLKDMWAKADFSDLGKTISDKLVKALNNIKWNKIKVTALKIGKSIATFLNGALKDKSLWESVGNALAQAVNTLTSLLYGFLANDKTDWGGGFALLINKFLENTNWGDIKNNIKLLTDKLIQNINAFLGGLNKEELSEGVSALSEGLTYFISSAISGIQWGSLIEVFGSVASAIVDGISQGLSQTDNPFLQAVGGFIGSVKDAFEKGDASVAADGLTTFFQNVFANISVDSLLSTLKDFFGRLLSNVFGSIQIDPNGIFGQLITSFQMVASTIGNILTAVFNMLPKLLPGILMITQASMNLFNALLPIIEAVLPVLNQLVAYVTSLISSLLVPALQLLTPVIQLICSILDIIMPIFDDIVALINETLGNVTPLLGPLTELLQAILTPISAILQPIMKILKIIIDLVIDLLSPIMDLIAPLIEMLVECFRPILSVITLIGDFIGAILVPVFKVFADIIRLIVIPIIKSVIGVFNLLGEGFKKAGELFNSFVDIFRLGFNEVKKFAVSGANFIASKIEWLLNAFINGVNKGIRAINKIKIDVPDWVPAIGGSKFGFQLKEMQTITIPRLAQGAVIPPNREFMAVLGDQSHGTNVEAPLDTIKQAVAEVLANNGNAEVIQLLQQLIGVVESKNLTIGDKEIAKANARYTNQQRIIRGASF